MKIKVKQVWDAEIKPDTTLGDIRNIMIGMQIFYPHDECYLTNKGARLIIRRIAG